ncbi:MAG: cation transporter [Candidatus Omnitrophica bacterium]|nr:cation transporter [Candidatus Omnitrophota bacterium]
MNELVNNVELAEKKRAITLSILTASFLTIFKMGFGLVSHSMAVLASAVDSLMDVLVSTVNFISLKEASKPADSEHTYGHGKIESLAGLFQSLFISASGIYLIYESIKRLVKGETISFVGTALLIMVVSTVITFFLVKRLKSIAAQTGSLIVGTESLHFATDLATNVGVMVALLLVHATGFAFWDLLIAIVIAIYILKQSFSILRNAIDELIDRALPDEIQEDVRKTILSYDSKVLGIHNFRTRKIGNRKFIDFHVELDKTLSFEDAHNLTESLIEEIKRHYPEADVNAHFDPEGER